MASGDKTYIADKVTQDKILEAVNAIKSDTGSLTGGVKEFTANGTFTVPAGVNKILITACAGGEGGLNSYIEIGPSDYHLGTGAGGDGGEWIFKKAFNVTPNQSISITVGKGGNGGSSSVRTNGGNTIIGSLITLLGGGVSGNNTGGKSNSAIYGSIDPDLDIAYLQGLLAFSGTKSGSGFRDGESNTASIQTFYTGGSNYTPYYSLVFGGGGSLGYGGSGTFGAGGSVGSAGGDGIVIIEW